MSCLMLIPWPKAWTSPNILPTLWVFRHVGQSGSPCRWRHIMGRCWSQDELRKEMERGTISPGRFGGCRAVGCPVNKRLLWHSTNWPSIYQLWGPARRASMLRFPQRRELTFAGHCQRRNTLEVKLPKRRGGRPKGFSQSLAPNIRWVCVKTKGMAYDPSDRPFCLWVKSWHIPKYPFNQPAITLPNPILRWSYQYRTCPGHAMVDSWQFLMLETVTRRQPWRHHQVIETTNLRSAPEASSRWFTVPSSRTS
jgi:hypothetical protein